MHSYLQISKINDFLFCPKSIFFHLLYENYCESTYHRKYQINGKISHRSIDYKKYSTSKHILQGINVISKKYGILGKIDIYDLKRKILIEKKYKITHIYPGYKYQIFAQYLCLKEMGYKIEKIEFYSISDNKKYKINLPDKQQIKNLIKLLNNIRNYNILKSQIKINKNKCLKCIYCELCPKC